MCIRDRSKMTITSSSFPKVLTVNVGRYEIDTGCAGHCNCCPIALAFPTGNIPGHAITAVLTKTIEVTAQDEFFGVAMKGTYRLPKQAVDFIRKFDAWDGMPLEPLQFEIELETAYFV